MGRKTCYKQIKAISLFSLLVAIIMGVIYGAISIDSGTKIHSTTLIFAGIGLMLLYAFCGLGISFLFDYYAETIMAMDEQVILLGEIYNELLINNGKQPIFINNPGMYHNTNYALGRAANGKNNQVMNTYPNSTVGQGVAPQAGPGFAPGAGQGINPNSFVRTNPPSGNHQRNQMINPVSGGKSQASSEWVCRKCGTINVKSDFCLNCGRPNK